MKIGILTAGGDCPGLNAVIRAIARSAIEAGDEAIGLRSGYHGLAERDFVELDMRAVSGILNLGGTILQTSSYDPGREDGGVSKILATVAEEGFDAVVAIGGEHTMRIAGQLWDAHRIPLVGVPKTIDNDVTGTDFTFGFDTAVQIATEAIDRLHTTAASHDRLMVVEVMGRNTGWIAAFSGIAGGADGILVPEFELTVEELAAGAKRRHERGKTFSIIVVAEGASLHFADGTSREVLHSDSRDDYGFKRFGGIGQELAVELEERTGFETRVTVLGHVQRGGTPTATDRMLATRYGLKAYELVKAGTFGHMAALHGTEMVAVPLTHAEEHKPVDISYMEMARVFFG